MPCNQPGSLEITWHTLSVTADAEVLDFAFGITFGITSHPAAAPQGALPICHLQQVLVYCHSGNVQPLQDQPDGVQDVFLP
jgi:hypothetical protein